MDEMNPFTPEEEVRDNRRESRRKLLKIMATTTGALGASFFLPSKWAKPLVDVVVLPAHAATSGDPIPVISNVSVFPPQVLLGRLSDSGGGEPASLPNNGVVVSPTHLVMFVFDDTGVCEVDYDANLFYELQGGGQLYFTKVPGQELSPQSLGTIGYIVNTTPDQVKNTLYAHSFASNSSNVLNATVGQIVNALSGYLVTNATSPLCSGTFVFPINWSNSSQTFDIMLQISKGVIRNSAWLVGTHLPATPA